jgi:hypothetical protein
MTGFETVATKVKRAGETLALRKASVLVRAMIAHDSAGAASSAPTGSCHGNTFGRRKREQAPALHRIAARLRLECGGLPPLSRALPFAKRLWVNCDGIHEKRASARGCGR